MTCPWLELLLRSRKKNPRQRFVQVATVSPNGEPEVRTVVLRGVTAAGTLHFLADGRSPKMSSLRAKPQLEMCIWWPDSNEQFRLRGPVHIIGDSPVGGTSPTWESLRTAQWRGLPSASRVMFLGATPGTPLEVEVDTITTHVGPPPHFQLVLLHPHRVDHLRLGTPNERQLFIQRGGSWEHRPVVP